MWVVSLVVYVGYGRYKMLGDGNVNGFLGQAAVMKKFYVQLIASELVEFRVGTINV